MIYDEMAINNGVIFQYAVDVLSKQMNFGIINKLFEKGMPNCNLDASLIVPIAVNSAFACELFIKSLLPKNTRGHKLNDIFNLLDINLKKEIQDLTINRMKIFNSKYCDTNFQEDLMHNSNVFSEWRYFHEGNADSFQYQFITSFMKSIFDIANKERIK